MHTPQKNLQALRDLLDTVNNNTRNKDTNLTDAMGNLTDAANNEYTNSLYEFGFVTSSEGEYISITDSMELPPLNAYVYGKSTQFTTGGNQLCDTFDVTSGLLANSTFIHKGVTGTKQSDGTILLNGTCTETFDIAVCNKSSESNEKLYGYVNKNYGTYTLSSSLGLNCTLYNGTTYVRDNFTSSETNQLTYAFVRIPINATYNNAVLKIMLNKGSTALPWEPYTGGIAAPNPDCPQPISHTGESGIVNYAITESNLCPRSLLKKGWYGQGDVIGKPTTNTGSPDAVYGPIFKFEYGKTLAWNFGSTNADYVRLRCADANGIIQGYLLISGTSGTAKLTNTYSYVVPLFLQGVPDECIIAYSDTVPTEDKLQTLTLQTQNGLKGIKVGKAEDANYTDPNGQHWACDYIDLAQGKYVQRIVEVMLDGREVFGFLNGNVWHMSVNSLFGTTEILQGEINKGYAMCDYFTLQSANYNCADQHEKTMYFSNQTSNKCVSVNSTVLFETQDAAGFKKFFSEHPTKIYAILKTPIERYLSAEELAQISQLTMNYPNTTILNDANTHGKIVYFADPNLYVQNLTNSILTLGGGV